MYGDSVARRYDLRRHGANGGTQQAVPGGISKSAYKLIARTRLMGDRATFATENLLEAVAAAHKRRPGAWYYDTGFNTGSHTLLVLKILGTDQVLYEYNLPAIRKYQELMLDLARDDPGLYFRALGNQHIVPFSFSGRTVTAACSGAPHVIVMANKPVSRAPAFRVNQGCKLTLVLADCKKATGGWSDTMLTEVDYKKYSDTGGWVTVRSPQPRNANATRVTVLLL